MYDLHLENAIIKDRYHIRRRIRCGNYTELFLGFDQVDKQVVILKALSVSIKGTPDADLEQRLIAYFETEAEVLIRLQHPSVIKLLESDVAKDLEGRRFQYLILEYMAGGDLMTLCRKHPLSLARSLEFTRQICLGLTCAHQYSIIHRDIKPQNLLLDAERTHVKISDFGIAKVLRGEQDEITRGIGTETYAPPECFDLDEEQAGLTPAADIYGLAKTLYVMLTGEAPREFFQRPIMYLPASIASEPYAPELLRIINQATQHAPSARYPDAEQLWHALEPLLQYAGPDDHDRVAEDTVIPGMASTRMAEFPGSKTGPSGVRVEVPIQAEPAQIVDESTIVRPTKRGTGAAPEQTKGADITPHRWTRRCVTAGLAACFMATSFWVHSRISGGWHRRRGMVMAGNLNVRDEPNTSSSTIGTIPRGVVVQVLRPSRDHQWFEVEAEYWDGRAWHQGRGWVSKFYVQLDQE